jgi:hypothetical protein
MNRNIPSWGERDKSVCCIGSSLRHEYTKQQNCSASPLASGACSFYSGCPRFTLLPRDRLSWYSTVYGFVACMNVTVTILDVIHHPVFYLKHNFSEIGFCHRLQMGPTQLGPIDTASPCLRTPATTPTGFIKPKQYKPTKAVNIFPTLNLLALSHTQTHTWGLTSTYMHRFKNILEARPHMCVCEDSRYEKC